MQTAGYIFLTLVLIFLLVWNLAYAYFEWPTIGRAIRHWLKPPHKQPIYGSSDPSRTNGPGAKANLKLVRG